MSKHIAFLSAAMLATSMLATSALPAAAADYYDGGDRPLSYHSRDDVYVEGGRAHVEHQQDLRPGDGYRRGPGPVVFDERGHDRGPQGYGGGYGEGYGSGEPGYRRPAAVERFGYDRPAAFIPHVEGPYGSNGYGGGYRPAAVAVGPAEGYGAGEGRGYGAPDEGCTFARTRSITEAGWEKTVTHRTCYRR